MYQNIFKYHIPASILNVPCFLCVDHGQSSGEDANWRDRRDRMCV